VGLWYAKGKDSLSTTTSNPVPFSLGSLMDIPLPLLPQGSGHVLDSSARVEDIQLGNRGAALWATRVLSACAKMCRGCLALVRPVQDHVREVRAERLVRNTGFGARNTQSKPSGADDQPTNR